MATGATSAAADAASTAAGSIRAGESPRRMNPIIKWLGTLVVAPVAALVLGVLIMMLAYEPSTSSRSATYTPSQPKAAGPGPRGVLPVEVDTSASGLDDRDLLEFNDGAGIPMRFE